MSLVTLKRLLAVRSFELVQTVELLHLEFVTIRPFAYVASSFENSKCKELFTETAVCCIVQIDPVMSQVHGDQASSKARAERERNEIDNKGQADGHKGSTCNHLLSPSALLRLRLTRPRCINTIWTGGGGGGGGGAKWPPECFR